MDSVVDITSVAHGGYGICRIDGQVCFVPYALPGDTVRVRVVRQTKGVLWGAIQEIVVSSPDRVTPGCPKFGECGGCAWLHFAYPAQAEWKRRIVRDCLERIARIETEVAWKEEASLRLGYRTRAEFHAQDGRLGFYAPNTHTVVDIERCPLCHDHLNAALERLRSVPVKESVEVVVHPDGGEVMVWTKHRQRALGEAFELVNSSEDGKPRQFRCDGVPVVNGAFSQASLLLNRMLVRTVHEMAGQVSSVLDLYCGGGNFSLGIGGADRSDGCDGSGLGGDARARVLGLDQNGAAIQAARALGRGTYRVGDETAFRQALEDPWDVVILDPPRTGAKTIANDLGACRANAIVYVSCDPATLARDLKVLATGGWRVTGITAVDMFPHTPHVETVCRLDR